MVHCSSGIEPLNIRGLSSRAKGATQLVSRCHWRDRPGPPRRRGVQERDRWDPSRSWRERHAMGRSGEDRPGACRGRSSSPESAKRSSTGLCGSRAGHGAPCEGQPTFTQTRRAADPPCLPPGGRFAEVCDRTVSRHATRLKAQASRSGAINRALNLLVRLRDQCAPHDLPLGIGSSKHKQVISAPMPSTTCHLVLDLVRTPRHRD